MSNTTEKKTYVANFKSFGNYGAIKGRIYIDKIKDHVQTDDKGRTYIPLIISGNKSGADQYGNTHYAVVDTWKPDPNYKKDDTVTTGSTDGLPF